MAVPVQNFTTGPSVLPDVGVLSYNGCTFSPLFATNLSGNAVKDEAKRTVMYMEYVITADGYVTLPTGDTSVSPVMDRLRQLLTAQAGHLVYDGRGCDLNVNPAGGGIQDRDVAWGPVPELLEFQPLGAGRSAKVQWKVTVRIAEIQQQIVAPPGGGIPPGEPVQGGGIPPIGPVQDNGGLIWVGGGGKGPKAAVGGLAAIPMLQFNYETTVSYSEDGFSTLSVRGILEIPMTRTPNQKTRTLTRTADDLRGQITIRAMRSIDLTVFHVTRRNFNLSRDKRVLTWDFVAEEKSYMDLPPDCTIARGTYSVRPAKAGMGLCSWLCTLRATYTVRADKPRRIAWLVFLALLRERMSFSRNANVPILAGGDHNPPRGGFWTGLLGASIPGAATLLLLRNILKAQNKPVDDGRRAFLVDFNIDEGLYLDSKTITFSATWRLTTTFSHILLASGIWSRVPEFNAKNENIWAMSMRDVQGDGSWLYNKADPKLDVIVDFGGG